MHINLPCMLRTTGLRLQQGLFNATMHFVKREKNIALKRNTKPAALSTSSLFLQLFIDSTFVSASPPLELLSHPSPFSAVSLILSFLLSHFFTSAFCHSVCTSSPGCHVAMEQSCVSVY